MALIREIAAERGLTVVCSLHQVDLALDWGDRIVGLRAGSIVLDTPTAGLTRDQVMEIYGRVATSTRELQAIDRELSEVRDALLSEELQRLPEHDEDPR
jgi:phosphonate transport system ATP-binding protein